MRSVTSYFNSTLYRKSLLRFWPIWGLYGLIWLFMMPLHLLAILQDKSYHEAGALARAALEFSQEWVGESLQTGSVLAMLFGVAAAMAVFSYLYNNRATCMMHALPVRRESLFFTHYLAGLSFLLLPNLAIFVLTLAAEAAGGCLELRTLGIWLLVQSAAGLFYFSLAAFCAMLTGHLLALPAFFGILNGLVGGVALLAEALLRVGYYGFDGLSQEAYSVVGWFTPLMKLTQSSYWSGNDVQYQLESATAVAIYAGVGVLLAAVALALYRRRQMELAGDVVAVRMLRPVFRYGMALCTGLTMGMLTCALLGWNGDNLVSLIPAVLAWTAGGYFVAEMLLRKSFRVWSSWKGGAAAVVVMAALFGILTLDLTGFETRVPAPEQVVRVSVRVPESAPGDSAQYGNRVDVSSPEQIAQVIALHQAAVDLGRRDWQSVTETATTVEVKYELTNGTTMRRSYYPVPYRREDLNTPGTATYAAAQLLGDRDFIWRSYGFERDVPVDQMMAHISRLWNTQSQQYEGRDLDGALPGLLWEAVQQDFGEGTIGVRYLFDDEQRMQNTCAADLTFEWYQAQKENNQYASRAYLSITLTPQASHTIALLREYGIVDDTHVLLTKAQAQDVNGVRDAEFYDDGYDEYMDPMSMTNQGDF